MPNTYVILPSRVAVQNSGRAIGSVTVGGSSGFWACGAHGSTAAAGAAEPELSGPGGAGARSGDRQPPASAATSSSVTARARAWACIGSQPT